MHLHSEQGFDLVLEVDATPAHHAILLRIGTLLDPSGQFSLLRSRQPRPGAGGFAVRQPGKPLRIVAMHPVAKCLPIHTAGLGRRPSIHALQNKRNRQHPPHRQRVLHLGCDNPQFSCRQIVRVISIAIQASCLDNTESHFKRFGNLLRVNLNGRW